MPSDSIDSNDFDDDLLEELGLAKRAPIAPPKDVSSLGSGIAWQVKPNATYTNPPATAPIKTPSPPTPGPVVATWGSIGSTIPGINPAEAELFGAEALGFGEFKEILDESDPSGAAGILAALGSGSAFASAIKARAASQRPAVKGIPLNKTVSTQVPLGAPILLKPGQSLTIPVQVQSLFRCKQFIATETVPGATVVKNIFVGAQSQLPTANSSIATMLLGSTAPMPPWTTAGAGMTISITVENIGTVDCTWSGTLIGDTLR